jgi:hypothetical protein
MKHVVDAIDNAIANRRIGEVLFDEVDHRENASKPLDFSSAKIIDDAHALAALDQPLHDMGADEAGAAGD